MPLIKFPDLKNDYKFLVSIVVFFLVLLPHVIWLGDNDYITFTYALHRTGVGDPNFFGNHLLKPLIFLGKQIGILVPFFVMLLFVVSKLRIKFNFKDEKLLFLLVINIIPIILVFLTSILMGVKIRTMWMTPFYLFMGVLFVYIFQNNIKNIEKKYFIFFKSIFF